ncbi:hypothetical protein A5680_06105 [Mycobacterium sp. E2989]|nr:hypothetical protein A5680_06105 [Mycobacterium sp. E2989]
MPTFIFIQQSQGIPKYRGCVTPVEFIQYKHGWITATGSVVSEIYERPCSYPHLHSRWRGTRHQTQH